MADLNDLSKPDGASNYQSEVWQTVRGHILRLWQGDYSGMSGLVAGVRRWSAAGGDVRLIQRNSTGGEDVLFDSANKVDGSYVNASVRHASVVEMGSASAIDCSKGVFFKRNIGASVSFTLTNVPAASAGAFGIMLRLNVTAAATITWPASFKWPSGTAPVLSSGSVHLIYAITVDGGTSWTASSQLGYAGA